MPVIDPLYVASGFGVGVLVGMTGVGGGSLMTPLLILLFGIHPSTAVGTDLLYAAATKAGGSVVRDLAALNKREMLAWDYWGLAREFRPGATVSGAAAVRRCSRIATPSAVARSHSSSRTMNSSPP